MYVAFSWEDQTPSSSQAAFYFQNPLPGEGYFYAGPTIDVSGTLGWVYSPDSITYSTVDSGISLSRQTDTIYVTAVYFGSSGVQLALYDVSGNELYNSNNATQFSGIQTKYVGYTNIFSPTNSMAIKLYKYNFQSGNTLTGSPNITGLLAAGPNLLPSYYEFVPPPGFETVRGTYTADSADSSRLYMNIPPFPSAQEFRLTLWTGPGFAQSPGIYIRPVVKTTQIRYNWNVSSISGSQNYILSCIPTDGGGGGGTVVLSTPTIAYTFNNLTLGKTYAGAINGSVSGTTSVSSIYRTVTTGNPPGVPINPSYLSTATTITLSWEPPAGAQTPPVGWYVVKDGAVKFDTKSTSITIPFDQTPHDYTVQSVSDTGYSLGLSTIVS